MILAIVHHWCKPGAAETVRQRIDGVGDLAAIAPGFVFRQRLENTEAPDKVTAITAWRDRHAYDAFRASRPPTNPADPKSPFERLETEVFEVRSTHGALRPSEAGVG